MGSAAHVIVDGDPALCDRAVVRVEQLEQRWSRFRAESEVCVLNRAAGRPVVVSADTVSLVRRCVTGWRATGGLFDPTVHDAMVANGYDRDLGEVLDRAEPDPLGPTPVGPAPGLSGVTIDAATRMIWLPSGVRIDPGGLGKGLAADMVTAELIGLGASGALVNLGGDLRARSARPRREPFCIELEDPFDAGTALGRVDLVDGAVATSSRLRRRWRQGGAERHHVIDPNRGLPTERPTVAATAIAPSAWWAEVQATRAMVAPDPFDGVGATSLLVVDDRRRVRATDDLEEVLRCSAH